jgi:hypothetical protein
MKALKSKLASEILADPAASVQLRQFLLNKSTSASAAMPRQALTGQFEIRRGNGAVRIEATVVPKAAKAA